MCRLPDRVPVHRQGGGGRWRVRARARPVRRRLRSSRTASSDYGGFRNILPPGQNGFDNLLQAAQFKAAGTYPPHSNDQLGMYSNLATAVPITEAQIPQFYKDATFGVPAGDVASTESPEPGRHDRARLAVRRARTSTATRAPP